MKALRSFITQFAGQYGMAGVLALLCLYYSVTTVTEQPPSPKQAAEKVASEVAAGERVMIAIRALPEDQAYSSALENLLKAKGNEVIKVEGEPRDARVALEKLVTENKPLSVIATTGETAAWTLLQNVKERFPALGVPRLVKPSPVRWPIFLTRENLLNVANQIAVVAILAAGMTVVIITGGIDLSVGSLIALSAVISTVLIRDHAGGVNATTGGLLWCSLVGMTLCGLMGAISGGLIAGFSVPPFIATLAMMQVGSGLAFMAAKGASIYELPEGFTWLGRSLGPLSVPWAVWLMLTLYFLTHVMMTQTTLGRRIYAVGGNAEAARLSGISVGVILLFAYTFCGAMAGLGGVLQASQLKSGAPNFGLSYELYAIAAVVVGGTSLAGGEGRIFGTLIGALIIGVIQNGMNLTGVESYSQKIVLGLVILAAVLADLLKRKDWRSLLKRWSKSR